MAEEDGGEIRWRRMKAGTPRLTGRPQSFRLDYRLAEGSRQSTDECRLQIFAVRLADKEQHAERIEAGNQLTIAGCEIFAVRLADKEQHAERMEADNEMTIADFRFSPFD